MITIKFIDESLNPPLLIGTVDLSESEAMLILSLNKGEQFLLGKEEYMIVRKGLFQFQKINRDFDKVSQFRFDKEIEIYVS